jgi:hypothetical protein
LASANIVGYQTKANRKFISQTVCTFDQVGVEGGVLDIQKLMPVDEDGAYIGDGEITIQFNNEKGKAIGAFSYYGEDEYDDGFKAGWYDEGTDELAEYEFAAGEGFQVYCGVACSFTFSGEVNMAETYIPCRKFLSAQGNIRPCDVDIQTIIPMDGTDEDASYIGDGEITIQFASEKGKVLVAYSYYGEDEYDDGFKAGWYDEGTDELAEYTFAPAEGFKLYAGSACYLRFPEL